MSSINPTSGVSLSPPNKAGAGSTSAKENSPESKVDNANAVVENKTVEQNPIRENQIKSKETQAKKNEELEQMAEDDVREKVETAVETIRGFIQENQRDLDFDVAQESNRVIITVKDKVTNEVIRQIPPEDAIKLSDRIKNGDDITNSAILVDENLKA